MIRVTLPCFFLLACSLHAAPRPGADEKLTAKIVSKVMTYQHYDQHPLDDEVSQRLFDAYIDRLDPNRSYFLASDIKEIRKYRKILDDLLTAGELEFAYALHRRLIERVNDRVAYAEERLTEPFDLTRDETILVDRSQSDWPADQATSDDLWRRLLKDRLLRSVLDDSTITEDDQAASAVVADSVTAERILRRYRTFAERLEQKDGKDVLETYLTTFTSVYDPHSTYMAPVTSQNFEMSVQLSLEGIGARLITRGSYTAVTQLIPGGPAALGGRLQKGHRIAAVEQADGTVTDIVEMPMSKVVGLIRGPKGTSVYLHVIKHGADPADAVPERIEIVRDKIKLYDNEAKSWTADRSPGIRRPVISGSAVPEDPTTVPAAIDKPDDWPHDLNESRNINSEKGAVDGIVVINLPVFYADFDARAAGDPDYKSTTRDVRRLIVAHGDDIRGLILDLRGNHGGSLDEAIGLAGLFLPPGPIVQVRNPLTNLKIHEQDTQPIYEGPLIVLVDGDSASSSEIVAASIQDYGRGIVIGETRTHGKGTVQSMFAIEDIAKIPGFRGRSPGTLKFTVSKFYRVTGESTQLRGVTPDIVLPSLRETGEYGEASLPYAMVWDKIRPSPYTKIRGFQSLLPELKARAATPGAEDVAYQERSALLREVADHRPLQALPLQLEARRQYRDAELAWAGKTRRLRRDKSFPMDQAIRIMSDLIALAAEQL